MERAGELKQIGINAFKSKDIPAAISAWKEAVQIIEGELGWGELRASILLNLSLAAFQTEDYPSAEQWATEAINSGPEIANDSRSLAKAYSRRGAARRRVARLHQAYDDIRNASILAPKDTGVAAELKAVIEDVAAATKRGLESLPPSEQAPFEIVGQVPRIKYDDPALATYLKNQTPVIITESPMFLPAVAHWDVDYLTKHIGNIDCTVFKSENQKFRYWDESKNEAKYEFIEHTEKLEMSFAQFSEQKLQAEAGDGSVYLQQALIEGVGDQILTDFKRFDWDLARQCQIEAGFGALTSNLLLVGMEGVVTPAHYDEQENLFGQVKGYKRVLMMAPTEFKSMYPFPLHHPHDRQSQLDIFDPDLEKFPRFSEVSVLDCVVAPGDMLYIPGYWWHHIISLTETVSVTFWYKCGEKPVDPVLPGQEVELSDVQVTVGVETRAIILFGVHF